MAQRWKTSASLIASQLHAKARELSFLNKQQNRNESQDQSTASQFRDTQNVSHRNSPGLRERSKGGDLPFQRKTFTTRFHKPGVSELGMMRYRPEEGGARCQLCGQKVPAKGTLCRGTRAGLKEKPQLQKSQSSVLRIRQTCSSRDKDNF